MKVSVAQPHRLKSTQGWGVRSDKGSMAFLEWRSDFDLGLEDIDAQHKRLVTLINSLHDSMALGAPQEDLADILQDLVQYTRIHFSYEEDFLRGQHYALLPKHMREHEELAAQVTRFRKDFCAGRIALSIPLLNFLKTWLREHILQSDRAYAVSLRAGSVCRETSLASR